MSDVKIKVKKSKTVWCLGDSLTTGFTNCGTNYIPYTDFLQNLHATFKFKCMGLDGDTTDSMFRRFRDEIKQSPPQVGDVLVILGGTNDLGHQRTSESIIINLKCIYGLAKKRGMHVISVTIPKLLNENEFELGDYTTRKQQVNSFISTCSDTHCIDLAARLDPAKHYDKDGLHLNSAGYKTLAELVKLALLLCK